MGLSLHYQGQLNDPARFDALIEELTDIAKSLKWSSKEISKDDKGIQGVILNTGDGTEPIPFLFDRDFKLRAITGLMGFDDEHTFIVSVKTQFGPKDTHPYLIGLLRHLKKEYFSNLDVTDEGGLWEGGSLEEYQRRKDYLGEAIERFSQIQLPEGLTNKELETHIIEAFKRLKREMDS